jgi:saccharopine dehydrogenase (NAD+, L-lysine-forming)
MAANALIIGTGGVGSVLGQKLHGYDCFERIYLGDVDTTYAQRLHERTRNSRFEVVPINAMETAALANFLREKRIAVVLNAATWLVNHSVLEACAQSGKQPASVHGPAGEPAPLVPPAPGAPAPESAAFWACCALA